jgi:hypothetical protein
MNLTRVRIKCAYGYALVAKTMVDYLNYGEDPLFKDSIPGFSLRSTASGNVDPKTEILLALVTSQAMLPLQISAPYDRKGNFLWRLDLRFSRFFKETTDWSMGIFYVLVFNM